jgi:hypothetical protein
MFYEVFTAVLLANLSFNAIMFFIAKFYFEHAMNAWLNSETDNA